MKQFNKPLVFMLVFIFSVCVSFAQKKKPSGPPGLSGKGYWVIEGNINRPMENVVWFYTQDDRLIYKETVTGVKLDPAKRKVRKKLGKALEASLTAWEATQAVSAEKSYVRAILN